MCEHGNVAAWGPVDVISSMAGIWGEGPDPWFIANYPRPPAGLVLVATEGRDHGRTTRMLKHHRDNPSQ